MLKSVRRTLWLLVLFVLISGCRNTPDDFEEAEVEVPVVETVEEAEKTASDPMIGTWDGDRYSNSFFGMDVTIPEGWHRFTEEELDIIEATGSAIAEASSDVTNLVGISKRPLDSQALFNPSLLVNIYKSPIDGEQGIMDLMLDVENSLKAMDLEFTFDAPSETSYFDGMEGVEMTMSLELEKVTIYQSFFVAVVDGWVVEVTATYSEEEAVLLVEMTGRQNGL